MGAHFGAVILEGIEPLRQRRCSMAGSSRRTPGRARHLCRGRLGKRADCLDDGAEGPGLSDAALEVADERLYIPIESETESLNVAAAAAVCLFEQRRRRLRVR